MLIRGSKFIEVVAQRMWWRTLAKSDKIINY